MGLPFGVGIPAPIPIPFFPFVPSAEQLLADALKTTEVPATQSATLRQATPTTPDPSSEFVRVDGTAAAEQRALIDVERTTPIGLAASVLESRLLLYKAAPWPSGDHTLILSAIDGTWDADTATYIAQPAVRSGPVAAVVAGGGAAGDLIEIDVTALVAAAVAADDATGSRWHGIRITTTTAGELKLYGARAAPEYIARLKTKDNQRPDPPTELSPSGERAVSEAKPELTSQYLDPDGDGLVYVRVQVDDADDFATPIYDSQKFLHPSPRFDMAALIANLLTYNQSTIETDTSGWSANANCTITRVTTVFEQGAAALSLSSTASGDMSATTSTGGSGAPVTAGQMYTATASLRAAASPRSCRMDIRWYDGAGALLSTSTGSAVADTATGFTRITVSAAAPGSATYAAVLVTVLATGAAAEIHYVDSIQLEQAGAATTFIPGIGTGLPPNTFLWWRVQHCDTHNLASDFSAAAKFVYRLKGTLTLITPSGATVDSPTPTISWSLSGGFTPQAYELLIEHRVGGAWLEHYKIPWTIGTTTSVTVPDASRLIEGESYKITVRVRDTVDRDDMAGDRAFYGVTREVTLIALSV